MDTIDTNNDEASSEGDSDGDNDENGGNLVCFPNDNVHVENNVFDVNSETSDTNETKDVLRAYVNDVEQNQIPKVSIQLLYYIILAVQTGFASPLSQVRFAHCKNE